MEDAEGKWESGYLQDTYFTSSLDPRCLKTPVFATVWAKSCCSELISLQQSIPERVCWQQISSSCIILVSSTESVLMYFTYTWKDMGHHPSTGRYRYCQKAIKKKTNTGGLHGIWDHLNKSSKRHRLKNETFINLILPIPVGGLRKASQNLVAFCFPCLNTRKSMPVL